MIFVLNKCYGGFSISDFAKESLGLSTVYPTMNDTNTHNLARLIKEYGSEKCSGKHARLKVVEIPDDSTDYEINEYDGVENITYVVDGRIHHA